MTDQEIRLLPLSKLAHGSEADLFALLTSKQPAVTRENKPYWKVAFRDAEREVAFPIWGDSPLAEACATEWEPGQFYKLRALYRETQFGPQLDIQRIRPVQESDRADGFDPTMCLACSPFDPAEMWQELVELLAEHIDDGPLLALLMHLLEENRELFCTMPAARRNHHAYAAGLLEHVLSVTKTCLFLAEKYAAHYPEMRPPIDVRLVLAGAVLHDIGKLREYQCGPQGAEYAPEGHLVGHILQGRDMLREAAAVHPIDAEMLLRLEHVIVSHHRLKEYGSPKPPMTPEAMLVHYADDIDARMSMIHTILRDDPLRGPITGGRNVLGHSLFRGEAVE